MKWIQWAWLRLKTVFQPSEAPLKPLSEKGMKWTLWGVWQVLRFQLSLCTPVPPRQGGGCLRLVAGTGEEIHHIRRNRFGSEACILQLKRHIGGIDRSWHGPRKHFWVLLDEGLEFICWNICWNSEPCPNLGDDVKLFFFFGLSHDNKVNLFDTYILLK